MKNVINKSILLVLLICILILVGCSKDTPTDTNIENSTNNTPSAVSSSEENNDPKEIKTDSGRYQGQIDNNSIEIKISGVPDSKPAKVFFLDEDFKDEFNELELKENQDIKFEYYENKDGQKIINKIEVLSDNNTDNTSKEIKTDSGRYQGKVDDNSIEIKISGVPDSKPARIFLLDEGFKDEFEEFSLDKDREIKFEYYVDENDQKVITRISIFGK